MDYQSMGVRQLQQACRDRGLPTARDKDTLVARLTEAETADSDVSYEDGGVLEPGWVERANTSVQTEAVVPLAAEPVTPVVWRERYPGGPLTDATHQGNCAAVVAAAQALGYTTVGGGYRAGTVDGQHVYEVHLRRPR